MELCISLTQEYASIYKLEKVVPPKIDLSENDLKKVKGFYIANCQSCHGENMQGLVGPSLVNIGQRIFYDEFKSIVQMAVDECQVFLMWMNKLMSHCSALWEVFPEVLIFPEEGAIIKRHRAHCSFWWCNY